VTGARRIASVDALRGFDMFWIIGGDFLVRYLYEWSAHPLLGALSRQLTHATWIGVHAYDLIFPLFIFLAGVSLGLSFRRKAATACGPALIRRAARRAAILAALGVLYNWGWSVDLQTVRFASVLGLIGGAYFLGVVVMALSDRLAVWLAAIAGVLLLVSGAQLLIPTPGSGAGVLTPDGAVNGWIDRLFLPGRLYGGDYDPEGLLGVFSASSIALAGMVAGRYMAEGGDARTDRLLRLAIAGVALIALGSALAPVYPPIKKLWTATFDIIAVGWCLMALAAFSAVFDRGGDGIAGTAGGKIDRAAGGTTGGTTGAALVLVVIGANSILIYMAARYVAYPVFAFADDQAWSAGAKAGAAALVIAVEWAVLYALYRRRLFLRV